MNELVKSQEFLDIYQRLDWLMIPMGIAIFVTCIVLLHEISVTSYICEMRSPLIIDMRELLSLGMCKLPLRRAMLLRTIFGKSLVLHITTYARSYMRGDKI